MSNSNENVYFENSGRNADDHSWEKPKNPTISSGFFGFLVMGFWVIGFF
jgi:hypothetical protein